MDALTEWRLFVCADCPEDDPYRFIQPVAAGASHFAAADLDVCPRCGSPGSFTPAGAGTIVVVQRTRGYGDLPLEPGGAL